MFPAYLWPPSPDQWPSYPWTVVDQSPLWWGYSQPYSKYPYAKLLVAPPAWFPSGHDPFVVVGGADVGADPTQMAEAARVNYLIRNLGEEIAIATARLNDDLASPHEGWNWYSSVERLRALGSDAVTHLAPALDAVTNGVTQPATQHAWQINAQLAAVPRRRSGYGWAATGYNTPADAALARRLLSQMQALYAGALLGAGFVMGPPA